MLYGCAAVAKLLVFMYTNQSLIVKWDKTVPECFDCSNGIKQGGVLSPTLFCVYIDELLGLLEGSSDNSLWELSAMWMI